jgi:hypothetical protein
MRLILLFLAMGTLAAAPLHAQTGPPPRRAYVLELGTDWQVQGGLPTSALLISLQGVANADAPRLYLDYPANWAFRDLGPLRAFLEARYAFAFERLPDAPAALAALGRHARGYVVWDKDVRTSLTVAFTVAGIEQAVVVSEDLIPLVEAAGLRPVEDLRGDFRDMTDAQIYRVAYDRYWERTSREFLVQMGGVAGAAMEPGVADFGIQKRAFFSDLSANPRHPEELALHREILGQLRPNAVVLGWHSYAKDTEGQHTALVSSYGLRIEGLNTLPNVSFTSLIELDPSFRFENNHSVAPDAVVEPEETVYIALTQSDALGIGAWTMPGRGRIPYTWQVLINWLTMNPVGLQYFYEQRTPNDYFVGGLSGPGYMYPKPIPPERFPVLMAEARRLMDRLDLRVFEVMDYSEGNRHVGNTDLPEEVVDRYYAALPDAIGFVNGYGAARTFDVRDGVPFMSYEYYVDPQRPEAEVTADLEELIALHPVRPYYLLVHVRESSSIERMANILDAIREPHRVVPLDLFLKMAGRRPTFQTRFQQPGDPVVPNPF